MEQSSPRSEAQSGPRPPEASDGGKPGQDAPTAALWEDFIDIFLVPARVFARRREGRWIGAYTVLIGSVLAVSLLFGSALRPMFAARFNERVAERVRDNPQLTPEALAQMREVYSAMSAFAYPFAIAATVILVALALWVIVRFLDARLRLRQALMVATYASFPRLLMVVGEGTQAFLLGERAASRDALALGPARFFDPSHTPQLLLDSLRLLDLFSIWMIVLIAVGVHATTRISKGSSALAAAIVWLLTALPVIIGAIAGVMAPRSG